MIDFIIQKKYESASKLNNFRKKTFIYQRSFQTDQPKRQANRLALEVNRAHPCNGQTINIRDQASRQCPVQLVVNFVN
jgi:hypothetical protein